MADPFLGQILQGGWNFAPVGWHLCNGALLSIQQNTALFSLLGTNFGGNGQTTFALPDLRGRRAIGTGQGPGLQDYVIGEAAGTEVTTLTTNNMPIHSHTATFSSNSTFNATQTKATLNTPDNNLVFGRAVDSDPSPSAVPALYCPAGTATSVALGGLNVAGTVTVGATGGSQPFSILDPYLAITTVIALQGIFPSRN